MFSVFPADSFWVTDDYEFSLDTSVPGVVTVLSTHWGRGCDNPSDIGDSLVEVTCSDGTIVDQLKRALMVGFQGVTSINMTFGMPGCNSAGGTDTHGRNFVFAGRSIPPGAECP